MDEPNLLPANVLRYRNAQRDRPVFQGLRMSMRMRKGETAVHIVPQYIRLEGIWQEDVALLIDLSGDFEMVKACRVRTEIVAKHAGLRAPADVRQGVHEVADELPAA